jgi:hypothetical protein
MDNFNLTIPALEQLNPINVGLNLFLCIIASFILRYVFIRNSNSLSGKFHLASIIPILATVIFLVILVVKSSLALSLGLVGALSVIRFRTPIKEPEDLVYLFLAIALGLGYGAGQGAITTAVFVIIVMMITFLLSNRHVQREGEFNLLIDWPDSSVDANTLLDTIAKHVNMIELQKYNVGPSGQSLYLKITTKKIELVQELLNAIKDVAPESSASLYEARSIQ